MQSSNPVLTRYEKSTPPGAPQTATGGAGAADPMFGQVMAGGGAQLTIADVLVKGLMVFGVTVVFAVVGWNTVEQYPWLLIVSMIIGLVLGLVNAFKREPSPPLILLYGVFQGLMLGGISNWYDQYAAGSGHNGIVLQAVLATMTTFGVMLTLYLTGVIKVTKKFQSILIVAVVSYGLIALASLIAALFGVGGGWGFYGITGLGLAICVIGVLLAAFFLLLDFEAISQGIKQGAPERESWRMAFGLLVTLIWLYLEFLRLLAIFSRN